VSVEDCTGPLTVSAVYLPPKPTVKHDQLAAFYNNLGHRFIAGGDYNAKHTAWGSRLISPRGREVLKTMEQLNSNHIYTGEPTYWPSDCNKSLIYWTSLSRKAFPATAPCLRLAWTYLPTTHPFRLLSAQVS
jgi:hypothetical protein